MLIRLLVAAAVLHACGPSTQSPPSPSAPPSPSPSPSSASSAQIDRDCASFADFRRDHCQANREQVFNQCEILARVAEAAQCVPQARRSFDCGHESEKTCSTAECCRVTISQCDDADIAFDHCVRGYCGGHGANPDCKAYGRMFGSNDDPLPPSGSGSAQKR